MRFTRIDDGIYRENKTGTLYERPWLDGKRTFRKLIARTVKIAREELQAKRTDLARSKLGLASNPYQREKLIYLKDILQRYQKEGYPTVKGKKRIGEQASKDEYRVKTLLPYWGRRTLSSIDVATCKSYAEWRRANSKRDCGRAIDLELNTLSNAITLAIFEGAAVVNPIRQRPRFKDASTTKHCRDAAPESGDEFHTLAKTLFEDPRSEMLGWQLLMEGMTGCRTTEILRLRWDAKDKEPGHIDGDWLWIRRAKGGINPFVVIHPALRECIEALKQRCAERDIKSPWWFPSRIKGQPISPTSLAHALGRISPIISKAHRTSHGLRAFYVNVRRSQGISDAQIAAELGDVTGAAIIASTYGPVPPNWQGRAQLTFLPESFPPSWSCFSENIPLCIPPLERDTQPQATAEPL